MRKNGGDDKKSLRLRGFDYASEGAYFVTLVTHKRRCLFGDTVEGRVRLSSLGVIADEEWFSSAAIRKKIELFEDEFVVMPNHVDGIVWIVRDNVRQLGQLHSHGSIRPAVRTTGQLPLRKEEYSRRGPKPKSLSSFIVGYKGQVTRRENKIHRSCGTSVWMRNYHDRIVRNACVLSTIRRYIHEDPLKWELDRYYSSGLS